MNILQTTNVSEPLIHFGKKGMRWGVRKDRKTTQTSTDKPKSNRQVLLEGRYIKSGLSTEDAAISATRRIRVEKIIAIAGATTLVAATGYLVTRHLGKEFLETTLKAGSPLQHVSSVGDLKLKDLPTFTTFDRIDKTRIHALFPKSYQIDLKATNEIRSPSNAAARKMLSEVLGNTKVMNKEAYSRFNYQYFYNDDPASQEIVNKFFDKVKSAGYNAILDPKPGGYVGGTKSLHKPLIVFDGASNLVKTGEKFVSKEKQSALLLGELLTKPAIGYGGITSLALGARYVNDNQARYNAVDSYFKSNPNSTYTRSEIASKLKKTPSGKSYTVKIRK